MGRITSTCLDEAYYADNLGGQKTKVLVESLTPNSRVRHRRACETVECRRRRCELGIMQQLKETRLPIKRMHVYCRGVSITSTLGQYGGLVGGGHQKKIVGRSVAGRAPLPQHLSRRPASGPSKWCGGGSLRCIG